MPVLRLSMLLQIFSLQKDVIPWKLVNYIIYAIIQEIPGFENKLNTPFKIEPPKKSDIISKQILPHCASQLRYCNKTPIRYESLLAWFIIMKHCSQLLIVLGIFLFPKEFIGFPRKDCRVNHLSCKNSMGHENIPHLTWEQILSHCT